MKLNSELECNVNHVAERNQFTTNHWAHDCVGFVRVKMDGNWLDFVIHDEDDVSQFRNIVDIISKRSAWEPDNLSSAEFQHKEDDWIHVLTWLQC